MCSDRVAGAAFQLHFVHKIPKGIRGGAKWLLIHKMEGFAFHVKTEKTSDKRKRVLACSNFWIFAVFRR